MSQRTTLITGATTGLGFSALQALATRSPSDQNLHTARSTEKGKLAAQKPRRLDMQAEIDVFELNAQASRASRRRSEKFGSHKNGWDFLVQNAVITIRIMMTTFYYLLPEGNLSAPSNHQQIFAHLSSTGSISPSMYSSNRPGRGFLAL